MNTKFDELTKGVAQSVTRRSALKKLGIGLAGMALACFGLATQSRAATCTTNADCGPGGFCYDHACFHRCNTNKDCPPKTVCSLGWCRPSIRFP
jgi:hypothetical protein